MHQLVQNHFFHLMLGEPQVFLLRNTNKHTLPSKKHTLNSHLTLGEPQGLLWGTLTNMLPSDLRLGELRVFTEENLTNATFSPKMR